MKRLGILVSGGGTNLQALIEAVKSGRLQAEIRVVISNKAEVYALRRAEDSHIPTKVIDPRQYTSNVDFTQAIVECLRAYRVELVCLAGFLKILDRRLTDTFPDRVLNIHPALLPAFGGKGMYGHHVHEAVIASGTKYTGATVHLVTDRTDIGPIVKQGVVEVADTETPASLAAKVLMVEHQIYPEAIRLVLEEKILIDGLRVKLKDSSSGARQFPPLS